MRIGRAIIRAYVRRNCAQAAGTHSSRLAASYDFKIRRYGNARPGTNTPLHYPAKVVVPKVVVPGLALQCFQDCKHGNALTEDPAPPLGTGSVRSGSRSLVKTLKISFARR